MEIEARSKNMKDKLTGKVCVYVWCVCMYWGDWDGPYFKMPDNYNVAHILHTKKSATTHFGRFLVSKWWPILAPKSPPMFLESIEYKQCV